MKITLSVPEQHDYNDTALELDVPSLKSWLKELPLLDTGDSLSQVLSALEPLNKQKLESELRFELLTTYLPVVRKLFDAAAPDNPEQRRLSAYRRRETADLVEHVSLALADGFKIVLKQWFAEGIHRSDPLTFARALRHAIRQFGGALINSYRSHRPVPPHLFLQMNQLYRLGRHFELHNLEIPDGVRVPVSLNNLYAVIMLLAVAHQKETANLQTERCFRILLRYASKIQLEPANSWQGDSEGLYLLDMASDTAPCPCSMLVSPVPGEDYYLLNAQSMIQSMREELAALPAEQRNQRLELTVLQALVGSESSI